MWLWLGLGLAGFLGFELMKGNKAAPATPAPTPLQGALTVQPYSVGQTVRVPLNQIPTGLIPATTMMMFQSAGASSALVQVTSVGAGTVSGNVVGTTDTTGNQIEMPDGITLPVTVPTAVISGLA